MIYNFDKAIVLATNTLKKIKKNIIKNCDVPWYNYNLYKTHSQQMKIIRKIDKLKKKNNINLNYENLNLKLKELRIIYKKEKFKAKQIYYSKLNSINC